MHFICSYDAVCLEICIRLCKAISRSPKSMRNYPPLPQHQRQEASQLPFLNTWQVTNCIILQNCLTASLRQHFLKKKKKKSQIFCTLNWGKKQPKHWSKGSNCFETPGALKAVASFRPYASLFRSGPRTYVVHPQHSKAVNNTKVELIHTRTYFFYLTRNATFSITFEAAQWLSC